MLIASVDVAGRQFGGGLHKWYAVKRPPQTRIGNEAARMTAMLSLAELDEEIRQVRANLRDLVEQQTARSGAEDENRGDELIAAQEEKLARLLKDRKSLVG